MYMQIRWLLYAWIVEVQIMNNDSTAWIYGRMAKKTLKILVDRSVVGEERGLFPKIVKFFLGETCFEFYIQIIIDLDKNNNYFHMSIKFPNLRGGGVNVLEDIEIFLPAPQCVGHC